MSINELNFVIVGGTRCSTTEEIIFSIGVCANTSQCQQKYQECIYCVREICRLFYEVISWNYPYGFRSFCRALKWNFSLGYFYIFMEFLGGNCFRVQRVYIILHLSGKNKYIRNININQNKFQQLLSLIFRFLNFNLTYFNFTQTLNSLYNIHWKHFNNHTNKQFNSHYIIYNSHWAYWYS